MSKKPNKPKPSPPSLNARLARLQAAGASGMGRNTPPPPKVPHFASGEPHGPSPTDPRDSNLAIALSAAVPLRILMMEAKGGPDDFERKEATAFSDVLGEKGDRLLFRSAGKPGEAADLFNQLARAIAVLAFCPGGVNCFGAHYEGKAAS